MRGWPPSGVGCGLAQRGQHRRDDESLPGAGETEAVRIGEINLHDFARDERGEAEVGRDLGGVAARALFGEAEPLLLFASQARGERGEHQDGDDGDDGGLPGLIRDDRR